MLLLRYWISPDLEKYSHIGLTQHRSSQISEKNQAANVSGINTVETLQFCFTVNDLKQVTAYC